MIVCNNSVGGSYIGYSVLEHLYRPEKLPKVDIDGIGSYYHHVTDGQHEDGELEGLKLLQILVGGHIA